MLTVFFSPPSSLKFGLPNTYSRSNYVLLTNLGGWGIGLINPISIVKTKTLKFQVKVPSGLKTSSGFLFSLLKPSSRFSVGLSSWIGFSWITDLRSDKFCELGRFGSDQFCELGRFGWKSVPSRVSSPFN